MTNNRITTWRGSTEWMEDAACKGVPRSVFFPLGVVEFFAAKEICLSCDVKDECLDFALRNPSLEGVWGGTSEEDRRRLRRQRRRSVPARPQHHHH
jgi:WhiB family redox-sensing transcriptional regulator